MEMKLPFLGDGVDTATVVTISVSVGDDVAVDQTVMELETDKAVAPIPATAAGKVEKILVSEGDKVAAGKPVLVLSGASAEAAPAEATPAPAAAPAPVAAPSPVAVAPQAVASLDNYTYVSASGSPAPTSPSIRKAALRFGIDLNRIPGSGPGGRIEEVDVRAYITMLQAKAFSAPAEAAAPAAPAKPVPPTVDFAKFGPVRREKMTSLREKIAEKMVMSWNMIPHVTQFDQADITDLMALRKTYKPKFEKKNASLTVTSFALKAAVAALKQFPHFNASIDDATNEIVYKEYYHIGVAVDTESGLIVPVIRDVDKKSVLQLSLELGEIAQKARDRKLTLEDLQGGTFTISNLGGLGVGQFTPIVNHPEVAIMAMSKGMMTPVFDKAGKMTPRMMLPLGMSYDHRLIDGADGARFMRTLVQEFENFSEALLKEK